jgi:hypothetical protein
MASLGPLAGLDHVGLSLALLAGAAAAQSSGNALFGGALRNDAVFAINAVVGLALLILIGLGDLTDPSSALLIVSIGLFTRVLFFTLLSIRLSSTCTTAIRPTGREVWPAYAITVVSVIGFQRLEAGFLQRRAAQEDLAAYGLAFDASQVVRGAATAAFAVLVPIFVLELARQRERTARLAGSLAVVTSTVVGLVSLLALFAARVARLEESVLNGVKVEDLAGMVAAVAGLAGANVLSQLLLAERRFDRYLAVIVGSTIVALITNVLVTTSARTASLTQLVVALAFVTFTAGAVQGVIGATASLRVGAKMCAATLLPAAAMVFSPDGSAGPVLATATACCMAAIARRETREIYTAMRR